MATKKKKSTAKGKNSSGRTRGRPRKSEAAPAKKSVGRPRGRPSHASIALEKFIEMQEQIMEVLPIMKEGLEFELRRNKELDDLFAGLKDMVPNMMKAVSAMTDQAKPFSVIEGGAVEADQPGKIIPIKRSDAEDPSSVNGAETDGRGDGENEIETKPRVTDRSGEDVPSIPV